MNYQDTWVCGKSTGAPNERVCASRYEAIRDRVLKSYSRPFTMFDLGAAQGYMSFRALEDFNCVAVMIEGGGGLLELCEANSTLCPILLRHRITVDQLEKLATCEHFDVVLALNVLHHFEDWERAANAVLDLGDRLVVETPSPDDSGACGQRAIPGLYEMFSVNIGSTLIARTQSHTSDTKRPMWVMNTPKTTIYRAYYDVPEGVPLGPVQISSTLHDKTIRFDRKGLVRDWIHGINLQTYRRLGGVWPTVERVGQMVRETQLPQERHGDIRPWNFILDGSRVHLIDGGDDRAIYEDGPSLDLTVKAVMGEVVL